MYEILIVEDDDREAARLAAYLERFGGERGVEFSVQRLSSAEQIARVRRRLDLIFLDIRLPGMDGMEAATLIRSYDSETPIIFVTSLASYAIAGYEVNALDFMVKPIGYLSFSEHMDRAMRTLERARQSQVTVSTRGGVHVFQESDLVYVETVNHDLIYHLAAGAEPIRVRGSLTEAHEQLGGGFLRISNHCVINMSHVVRARGDAFELSDGSVQYASRARKREALAALARYLGRSA